MRASEASRNHTRADLVLLHQLWAEGVPTAQIAERFGVAMSTVTKWGAAVQAAKEDAAPSQRARGTDARGRCRIA